MIRVMIDHVSIQCADVSSSASFYDSVLAPLGASRVMDFGEVIGYGIEGKPDFWLGPLVSGEPNRENHLAFRAKDRASVRAFFDAAVALREGVGGGLRFAGVGGEADRAAGGSGQDAAPAHHG